MPSWLDRWVGAQDASLPDLSDATLKITDGDVEIDFTRSGTGWFLLGLQGWQMQAAQFKGGGTYSQNVMGDGANLRHTAFSNVVESWRVGLHFYSPDGMLNMVDQLEELLKVRAPRYWTQQRYHKPVYIERRLPTETQTSYALISQGSVALPQDMWDQSCLGTRLLSPVLISYVRSPFWLGAPPGTTQGTVELSVEQDWDYKLIWAEETNLPAGQVYCFMEDDVGLIYAGGASEILRWWSSSWNVLNVAPVAIAGNVTSAVKMTNGDILFGDNGQVIKVDTAGTWSVESALPAGQVEALLLTSTGVVYAGDSTQILKRAVGGTWSVDTGLPLGQTYSLCEDTVTGRCFAGGEGEILRTVDPPASTDLKVWIASVNDHAEQYGSSMYVNPTADSDITLFNRNWIGFRFALDIPANATINSAHVDFTAYKHTITGTSEAVKLYCEDTDDSAAFTSTDNDISDRTLTTAFKAWQVTQDWRYRRTYSSPDLTAAVQEVIDRAAWASGNHLSIILKSDTLASGLVSRSGQRETYSYELNPDRAPRIVITYTPAPAAGSTWEVCSRLPTGNVTSLLKTSGHLVLAGEDGQILGTKDNGQSWGVVSTLPTGEVRALYEAGGYVWAGDNGNILRSTDGGRTWASHSTVPTGYVEAFVEETATDDMRAGDNGRILILDETLQVGLGRTATDDDEVFVANHHKTCNLTNIHIDDGGVVGGNIFPITTFSTTLLPAIPAVNDAIYFGVDTSLTDSGPFCSLIFDIDTPARATTSYTITWEYWNGAWTTLTVHDETESFSEPGVNGVFWAQPSDWATTNDTVGTTGYWVRARVSAIAGTLIPPTQQNRTIYSAITPFVELANDQTGGNVDSLIKMQIHNRSDEGGPGGSAPTLYQNRILAGVKEVTDHENFRAFLNFADEQNPAGVTLDVTVDPDSATSIEADSNLSSATGRRVFFDASTADGGNGLNNFEDRVEFELDTTIARDYYGTYKAFLRCKQNGGSAGEVSVRLKVVSGTGGISAIGDTQVTASTTDHEIIEFDNLVTIPVSSQFTADDIGDTTSIIVQISAAETDADMYLYVLFLLPTDDVWVDAEDGANSAESSVEDGRGLIVDSITIPKAPTRALVQKLATNSWVSSWNVDGNGASRLLPEKQQRVWFLMMRTTAAASSTWISEPEACVSVTIEATNRWLTGRGSA